MKSILERFSSCSHRENGLNISSKPDYLVPDQTYVSLCCEYRNRYIPRFQISLISIRNMIQTDINSELNVPFQNDLVFGFKSVY